MGCSRVNSASRRAIEIAPRYSGPPTGERIGTDSPNARPALACTERLRTFGGASWSSASRSSVPTSGLTANAARSDSSSAVIRSPISEPTS